MLGLKQRLQVLNDLTFEVLGLFFLWAHKNMKSESAPTVLKRPCLVRAPTSKRITSLRTVAETRSKSLSYCVTLASHCDPEKKKLKAKRTSVGKNPQRQNSFAYHVKIYEVRV